jgi:phosphomannomutase
MKGLIIFDLDGTLARSKLPIDAEMGSLLAQLLEVIKVAIISGGAWLQFEKQVLSNLPRDNRLKNLSILPTCGTQFYHYDGTWQQLYSEDFSADEKLQIIAALNKALDLSGLRSKQHWGDLIEDRASQITLSALGQEAPLEEKKTWDADFKKREEIKGILQALIPAFSIHFGGTTSIDVTKPGIDKAYGIKKLEEVLRVDTGDMIFIGDALFPSGNDYPAKQAGVLSIAVRDPHETKRIIETIIACLDGEDSRCPTSS